MDRTIFYAKSLVYVCSFDLHLKGENGTFPSQAYEFKGKGDARVYNALNEARTLGAEALKGRIQFLQQWIVYPAGQHFAELRGRLTILADDGAVLESEYAGVFHPDTLRRELPALDPSPLPGAALSASSNLQTKAFLSMRFDTGSTKYRWLVQYQCAAFGRLALEGGTPILGTFDVYAMTTPVPQRESAAASE
jgi:hypothetical protein